MNQRKRKIYRRRFQEYQNPRSKMRARFAMLSMVWTSVWGYGEGVEEFAKSFLKNIQESEGRDAGYLIPEPMNPYKENEHELSKDLYTLRQTKPLSCEEGKRNAIANEIRQL